MAIFTKWPCIPWRIHGAGIYIYILTWLGLILMGSMERHIYSSTVRIRHGKGMILTYQTCHVSHLTLSIRPFTSIHPRFPSGPDAQTRPPRSWTRALLRTRSWQCFSSLKSWAVAGLCSNWPSDWEDVGWIDGLYIYILPGLLSGVVTCYNL